MALIENEHYKKDDADNWTDLIKIESKHKSDFKEKGKETEWIFRGQQDRKELQTTLERALRSMSIPAEEAYEIESGLIRKFQRQYYHYDLRYPRKNDITEWLSLMRHHGAPVRLLDWTYSFYVALFFAIEEAEGDCAVWALEKKSIIKNVLRNGNRHSILPEEKRGCLRADINVENYSTWKTVFGYDNPTSFVFPLTPFRLNERLVIQQGDFLCPGDISKTFQENLAAVLPDNPKDDSDYRLFKYVIKYDIENRKDILLQLHRMNINRATLFPGLDGFAQSLKILMVSPKNLLKPHE